MIKPLQDSYIQGYRHGQKTFYSDKHLGVDWICREGLPIYSPEDGKIINLYSGQGGNTIILRSKDYTHRFMHLSRFNIKLNDNVKAGQVVGYTGNTGMSTASHLHWDISKGNLQLSNFNNFVDPLKFNLKDLITNKDTIMTKDEFISITRIINRGDFEINTSKPNHINIDHYYNRYTQNRADFEKIIDDLIHNIYDLKNKQGIRFMDGREMKWRTLSDIQAEK